MKDDLNGFYTMKGYQLNETGTLTASMEDYLEMICRLAQKSGVVRINELAAELHVKPSSASKMVYHLLEAGFLDFQKYGYIVPTGLGKQTGDYLLYRHEVLHRFLCLLNHSENELEQVEKIEHFLNKNTIDHLAELTRKILSFN